MKMSGTPVVQYITGEGHTEIMAGVYYKGTMYYDFSRVTFINNSGVADLIDLVKSWLEMGIQVKFLQVSREIKEKIEEHGINGILYCE